MRSRYRRVGPIEPVQGGPLPQDDAALAEHRDSLFARLEQGYERIEQAMEEGQDVESWEDFWVSLLNEYERVCEELQRDLAV